MTFYASDDRLTGALFAERLTWMGIFSMFAGSRMEIRRSASARTKAPDLYVQYWIDKL